MGSQRLPGKVMAELGGYPILQWVCHRVMKSQMVDKWVIVTSADASSDPIAKFCEANHYEVYRGSESDVFSRFVACANKYQPEYIVRVCADSPFTSAVLIDDLIMQVSSGDVYLANHKPTAECQVADGFGAEVLLVSELLNSAGDPQDKQILEHVSLGLAARSQRRSAEIDDRLKFPYLRFDIDSRYDLESMRKLVDTTQIGLDCEPWEIVVKKLSSEIQDVLETLFPMNRSLAGEANRQTLEVLQTLVPISRHSIASDSKVYDWNVPREWSVNEGWIKNRHGEFLVDFFENQLHVISYSSSVDLEVSLDELVDHLHTHELGGAIPYRTSYYVEQWGFAVTREQYERILADGGPFQVRIDASFDRGVMDYADLVVQGQRAQEILVSSYICHPSLANDSLSGVILSAFLARHIGAMKKPRYTYRFAFVPETIGALVYLKSLGDSWARIFCGLQITTVGGPGSFQLKQSWDVTHPINKLARKALEDCKKEYSTLEFDIHGSDERQYSSPGFRINMVTIGKDIYYTYPQYHTSLDNLDFVSGRQIAESLMVYLDLISKLESRRVFVRTEPRGEPMLSKRHLYHEIGGSLLPDKSMSQLDMALWILFLTDGLRSTDDIAEKINVDSDEVLSACLDLTQHNLLREI